MNVFPFTCLSSPAAIQPQGVLSATECRHFSLSGGQWTGSSLPAETSLLKSQGKQPNEPLLDRRHRHPGATSPEKLPLFLLTAVLLLALMVRPACAQFVESEPNNDKTNADAFTLSSGATIRGNTQEGAITGQGDYFRLTFSNSTPGFYRNTLNITSTTSQQSHVGSIRGLTQTNRVVNAGTDTIIQNVTQNAEGTASNLFYTAGTGGSMYYRVSGSAATTADYTVTYQSQRITPIDIGAFARGNITFTSVGYAFTPAGGQTDTSFAIFDSNFNLIGEDTANVYMNDNAASGSPGSTLTRNFSSAGTYYLAVTYSHLSTASSAALDDTTAAALSAPVLDFSNVVSNANNFTNRDISFRAYNGSAYVAPGNPAPYADRIINAIRTNSYEVNFYQFTVVLPEPGAGAILALGGAMLGLTLPHRNRTRIRR